MQSGPALDTQLKMREGERACLKMSLQGTSVLRQHLAGCFGDKHGSEN